MESANSYVNKINHYSDLVLFASALRKPVSTMKSYSLTLFCKGNYALRLWLAMHSA